MDSLNSLPGDNSTNIPLDPNKEEFKLPVESDEEFKLPIEESPLMLNYQNTIDIDPMKAAKVVDYSKRLNENPYVIEKNLDGVEKFINAPDSGFWMEYEKRNPKSAEFLKDTKNFAMAKNDIEKLAGIEKTIQDKTYTNNFSDSLKVGINRMASSAVKIPALMYELGFAKENMILGAIGREDLQFKASDSMYNNPVTRYFDKNASDIQAGVPQLSADTMDTLSKGEYGKGAEELSLQFASNLPQLVLSIAGAATFGPAVGGLIPGATTAADSNAELRDKGVDISRRNSTAVINGAIELYAEKLTTLSAFGGLKEAVISRAGKDSFKKLMTETVKKIIGGTVTEGAGEGATEVGQSLSNYLVGGQKDALDGLMQRTGQSTLVGMFGGGGTSLVTNSIAGYQRASDISKTEVLKKQYSDLGKMAIETDLFKNSPETQEVMLKEITKDTKIENVYLPVEDAKVYFQSKGIPLEDIAKTTGIESEISEAIETGSDIKIPLATWISKFANTEHYEGLKEDIKYSPEDFTARQNKDYNNEIFDLLNTEASTANENAKLSEDQKAQSEIVFQDLKKELINREQDSNVADELARLFTDRVITRAARRGISIEQSYKDLRPTIQNGDSSYSRQPIPEFKSDNIVNEDQVKSELIKMGLPETYQSSEAISAIRAQLAFMYDDINQSQAGKASGTEILRSEEEGGGAEKVDTSTSSTFPSWARGIIQRDRREGTKEKNKRDKVTKSDFLKILSKGNSKHFAPMLQRAIEMLRNGSGDNPQNLIAPNLDFVALVDPESLGSSIETERLMAQRKDGKFFQTDRELRNYLDKKTKGKAIVVVRDSEAPAAEFDKVTGQLIVNSEKINLPEQVDQIISQFGETKKESITGKIETKIDGETVEIDARKAVNALAAKLYNLERLSECSR